MPPQYHKCAIPSNNKAHPKTHLHQCIALISSHLAPPNPSNLQRTYQGNTSNSASRTLTDPSTSPCSHKKREVLPPTPH